MFSKLVSKAVEKFELLSEGVAVRLSLFQIAAVSIVLIYCCWRLWRFTIRPLLRPQEPQEYPYSIPLLGHGISFFKNSNALIERALNYLGRTHEPFKIQVGPECIYIVIAPEDVSEVYKRADTLEWAGHLDTILTNFGCTQEFIRLGRTKPGQGKVPFIHDDPVNPRQLPLIPFIEKTYHQQLMPGPHMTKMSELFVESLQWSANPANTKFFEIYGTKVPSGRRVISLKKLCEYSLLQAGIDSFFGNKLLQIDSDLISKMLAFNAKSWMLFFGVPHYFSEAVRIPQKALMETFQTFVNLPSGQRHGQSWGVQQILTAEENVGIDLQSRAAILLMVLWASNTNINNIAFWTLAHICTDSRLRDAVRQETGKAWKSESLDVNILTSECPVLAEVFYECLRTKGGAMTGRVVRKPTRIGGKLLQPGSTVLLPSQQLHTNEKVWGPTSGEFDSERFRRDKSLAKHPSYRPFGGGVSMCPGRVIAKEEVYSLVAIMLYRFDVQVSGELPHQFPRLNRDHPGLGITGPEPGMDIWLDINDRAPAT